MIFYGELLQVGTFSRRKRITVGVEEGYHFRYYDFYLQKDNKNIDVCKRLRIGDKLFFTGTSNDNNTCFRLKTIVEAKNNFHHCPECGMALISDTCSFKHVESAKRYSGKWKVVHKIDAVHAIKLYFEKDPANVFSAVANENMWLFSDFKRIQKGDSVELEGWRDMQRSPPTSLKYIRLTEKNKNPNGTF